MTDNTNVILIAEFTATLTLYKHTHPESSTETLVDAVSAAVSAAQANGNSGIDQSVIDAATALVSASDADADITAPLATLDSAMSGLSGQGITPDPGLVTAIAALHAGLTGAPATDTPETTAALQAFKPLVDSFK